MHRRPHLFRCHRCDALVYVAQARSGLPAIYSCGHKDKLADLTTDDLPPFAWGGLVASQSNYIQAGTATSNPLDDLKAAIRLVERPGYVVEPIAFSDWLTAERQARFREMLAELRRKRAADPGGEPPPPIISDVS